MKDVVDIVNVKEEGSVFLSEIQTRIYTVRNVQVMIDIDLANFYGVENRVLRQAVRRNIQKFPEDFLFMLSADESNNLISRGVSQTVIPHGYNTGGMQMYAFTEQGVMTAIWLLTMRSGVSLNLCLFCS